MPDGLASIVAEEGISEYITLTIEQGLVGGIPQGGVILGCATNPEAILDQPAQFDFYDGVGRDLAFLGAVQVDAHGKVNSSRFAGNLAGCGGFINISQNARKVIFCGTFTAGGLETTLQDKAIKIVREGRHHKFIERVEQIAFSELTAQKRKQNVLFVTERAVFELKERCLVLTEIAPGIDLKKDILNYMGFAPIIQEPLKQMASKIFRKELMGLYKQFKSKE